MSEFVFLFRQPDMEGVQEPMSDAEINLIAEKWHSWIAGIKAQGKLANHGSRLNAEGKVLKPGGVVTDGPFVEIKEKLGGFIIVSAEHLEEATTLAHGCPALDAGGSVEVRPIFI